MSHGVCRKPPGTFVPSNTGSLAAEENRGKGAGHFRRLSSPAARGSGWESNRGTSRTSRWLRDGSGGLWRRVRVFRRPVVVGDGGGGAPVSYSEGARAEKDQSSKDKALVKLIWVEA